MFDSSDSPYTYHLPSELIAHRAAEPRESARLLAWPEKRLMTFEFLPDLLNSGDLLVVNESKVIPARIFAERQSRVMGGVAVRVELLLHRPLDTTLTRWQAFAKPGRRLRDGDQLILEGGAKATVDRWQDGFVILDISLSGNELESYLNRYGHTPLPPYIHAEDTAEVRQRYQTTYARVPGSVAAPTAGLHLSDVLMNALTRRGVKIAKVTLHVGAGTFQNPTQEQIANGKLHAEWCDVPMETVKAIQETHKAGRDVVAIGTTTLRTLESAAQCMVENDLLQPFSGETTIFIKPGFKFRVVDRLITNFHLPGSSLLMLVAAFIGEDAMRDLYEMAIAEHMRFYSFGDGSLLTRAG